MTISNNPLSRKDIALRLLDNLRVEIENDDINAAMDIVNQLDVHVGEWQRRENLQSARAWLDDAFADDLLAFDSVEARELLQKWEDASTDEDNPELANYRERVEQRRKEKNTALLIRGVISHCDDILAQAKTLEASSEPPAPSFMLKNYYRKAHNIAVAAQADHATHTELEQLASRVERILNNKESAAVVYSMALESQKYSNALHNLDQLPADISIPRFTASGSTDSERRLTYQGMVSLSAARREISQLAKIWAEKVAKQAIKTSQQYLESHEPQDAVDELTMGDNVEKFLDADQKSTLETAQSTANTQLRNREKAGAGAQKAIELAGHDALKAWEEYAAAYQTYQWVDGLDEARQAVVKGMQSQVTGLIQEADIAFHEARDMEGVRNICQTTKSLYAGKDDSVDTLLKQFDEFEEMTHRYEEYIRTGNDILERVKASIWDDAVAANELLTQVETYPDFVLEAFTELYDLRVQVNQRLNADQTYNQLYKSLFSETLPEVTQAIERTNVAAGEFQSDERFGQLERWLKYHMAFVSAEQHYERGAYEHVLQLIAPVLGHPEHPDYETAQKMKQEIEAQSATDGDA